MEESLCVIHCIFSIYFLYATTGEQYAELTYLTLLNRVLTNAPFKSCWNNCIYKASAHERHHNDVITGGKLAQSQNV